MPLLPFRPLWVGLLPLLSCLDTVLAKPRAPLYCLPGEACSALCTAFKASGAEACGRLRKISPSALHLYIWSGPLSYATHRGHFSGILWSSSQHESCHMALTRVT